ncbi:MAG: N-acetylmuramoyl-L-alanine amidase, partial [Eggerthellaceae bacterium]|nr:N-acetylmuramoyl-L-alanine amidase [Eggerthellaceae bacterium]
NASQATELEVINDILVKDTGEPTEDYDQADDGIVEEAVTDTVSTADELRASLNITEDYRDSFVHGDKGAEYQKYIMLHDTEGDSDAESVISWWDSNGAGVAAHFVINKDGSIVQCVDMDKIAHHAGFGDTGHNEYYGVTDESRDDKVGTEGIGDWASDYGMNSYSIGIELVHVSGEGDYPEAQLEALDNLIAYIDAYYGFESTIIDHKAWRTGNSDTSAEFAQYLESYQSTRRHN